MGNRGHGVSTSLRVERAAASAAARRIRILEREAGALHRRDVIDRDATQVLRRERVDEHAEAIRVDHEIVVCHLILDEQPVLEAAAAAGLHADAKAALLDRDALGFHEPQDLGGGHRRHHDRDGGLLCRAHDNLLTGKRGNDASWPATCTARSIAGAGQSNKKCATRVPAAYCWRDNSLDGSEVPASVPRSAQSAGTAVPVGPASGTAWSTMGSLRNERAIQANAAAATASNPSPFPSSPNTSLPNPNRVAYTATMPA